MNNWLDWLIAGVCTALGLMAEYRAVFDHVFSPFPLAASIALLVLVRLACEAVFHWMNKPPVHVTLAPRRKRKR
jgi:hypothetical protein